MTAIIPIPGPVFPDAFIHGLHCQWDRQRMDPRSQSLHTSTNDLEHSDFAYSRQLCTAPLPHAYLSRLSIMIAAQPALPLILQ